MWYRQIDYLSVVMWKWWLYLQSKLAKLFSHCSVLYLEHFMCYRIILLIHEYSLCYSGKVVGTYGKWWKREGTNQQREAITLILKLLPRWLVGSIDYYSKWQWNDKSKFLRRQKLAATILFVVSSSCVPFSLKISFTSFMFRPNVIPVVALQV